jgi:hypothetical protein
MPVDWREHIVSTPDVLRGKPRIKGTRIPVSLILAIWPRDRRLKKLWQNSQTSAKSRSQRVWIMPAHSRNLKWSYDGAPILR